MTSLLATTAIDNTDATNPAANGGFPGVEGDPTQAAQNGSNSGGVNWEKRYKDLQSYHDREKARLTQELEQAQASTFTPPSTPEEVEAFKREHPEVFNMIQTLAYQHASGEAEKVKRRVDEVDARASRREAAKAEILARYPDFAGIVSSPDFQAWAKAQTEEVQGWVFRNPDNASLAIAALDLYKAAQASNKNDSQSPSQASAADAIQTNSAPDIKGKGKIWKGSEIKSLRPQEYEKYEEEIDKAWLEGRVDLSQ